MSDNPEPFCRVKEAVKLTPFSKRTFETYVKSGRIPSFKFGHSRLYRKSEVIAAIESFRVATKDEVLR
jgi:excisionase family DNA binding protein